MVTTVSLLWAMAAVAALVSAACFAWAAKAERRHVTFRLDQDMLDFFGPALVEDASGTNFDIGICDARTPGDWLEVGFYQRTMTVNEWIERLESWRLPPDPDPPTCRLVATNGKLLVMGSEQKSNTRIARCLCIRVGDEPCLGCNDDGVLVTREDGVIVPLSEFLSPQPQ